MFMRHVRHVAWSTVPPYFLSSPKREGTYFVSIVRFGVVASIASSTYLTTCEIELCKPSPIGEKRMNEIHDTKVEGGGS
jgi:hypothetical protein